MSKGSARRPGTGYANAWERIFSQPEPKPQCPTHREPVEKCGCYPTEDGPGQDEASQEVKTHYERRRFDREGV